MKKFFRFLLWLLASIVVILAILWFIVWKSPKYYTDFHTCKESGNILRFEKYDSISATHPRPFIIQQPNLLVYGATHTRDKQDPEIKGIEEKWKTFKPTMLLVEGRLGFLFPGLMDPVEEFGEMGKAAQLAKDDGIPVYTWDTPKEDLVKELLKKFSPEQVALHQILNPYFSSLRFGKPSDPDAYVKEYLKRGNYPGLENTITSIADIDRIWKRDFPNEKDWRDTSDEYGLPGYLQSIMDEMNDIRNRRLVCIIVSLKEKGERPFIITGSSHAACIDNALKQ